MYDYDNFNNLFGLALVILMVEHDRGAMLQMEMSAYRKVLVDLLEITES